MSTSERRTDRKHHTPRRNHPLLSWYALFFLLCLLFLPMPAHAQQPGPTTWEWRTFTADNSPLAPGMVQQLVEDSRGRIWIGTDEGISLYQAGTWQTFTADNSPLALGGVQELLEDAQGRIWVGTAGGVSVYAQSAWQTFTADNSPLAPGEVNTLLEVSQSHIWVGTGYYDGATYRGGVSVYAQGDWQTFTADNSSLAPGKVTEFLEDSQSRIWVGTGYYDGPTSKGGVSVYVQGTWQTFTADNSSLAPGWVSVLLEDAQGRIWVGTKEGISFYLDGTWQTFTTDRYPLPPAGVNELLEDSQGRIWVGTWDGVSLFDGSTWQTFTVNNSPLALNNNVWPILEDSRGRIWVATDGGVSFYQDGIWHTFTADNSPLASGRPIEFLEDSQGRIWVGTNDYDFEMGISRGGVSLFDGSAWQTFTVDNTFLGGVRELLEDSQGRIWVGTEWAADIGGISLYQEDLWQTFTADNSPLAPGWANVLLEDAQGRIWVATDGGVSLYQDSIWHTFTVDNSPLASGRPIEFLEDSQGRIWVGTNDYDFEMGISRGGVSLFDGSAWQTFTAGDFSLATEMVTELLEDSQGRIWVGSRYSDCEPFVWQGGVSFYDGSAWQTFTPGNSPLAPGGVTELLEDTQGRIWVGTEGGVSFYQDGIWHTFAADNSPLASGSRVTGLLEDSQGRIWVATDYYDHERFFWRGIVSRYDESTWQTFTVDTPPTAPYRVTELLEDSQRRIWVGAWDSVSLYDGGGWQNFAAEDSYLAPGMVTELLQGSKNRIWVGTWGGVSLFDGISWQAFTAGNSPLVEGEVNMLLEDSQGRIWVGTGGGVSLFDGISWQTFTAGNSPLVEGEVNILLEDSQGRIWVGTNKGLSMRRLGDRPFAFLHHAGLAFGQTPSLRNTAALTLTFPSHRSSLEVSFSGIDAESDPDRLLFRCQLEGYNEHEVPCASPVRYPALPPGTYTFRVRALDEDLMSSEPATATFTLVSTTSPTPTPTLAPTPTPRIVEVERVVPGLPREAVIPLVGGLGGLVVAIVLGAMIRSRIRRARALRRGFNPYEAGRPVLDPHRFFGREALIAQVLNTIHQNDVLIHGERRIGKTSLLRQLEHRLRAMDDPDYQFIPVYADVEGVPQAEFFHLLMEEIVAAFRESDCALPVLRFAGKAAAAYTYRDFLHDIQSLLEVPQAASHRTIRLILLMDEVDVMNSYDQLVQQQFRRILMKRFARQVGVVASGVHVFREWSRDESPFRNLFVEIHLGTMEEEAARRLITEPVKGIYSYDDEAVDLILRYSEHKPWRIQRLCLELVNRLLAERRTRVTRQDVEEVHRRMLTEEAEWDVPQGEYPALVPASLSAAEAEAEYRAQSEEGRNA
jgi:ligand-binding sensor domain-containing protein